MAFCGSNPLPWELLHSLPTAAPLCLCTKVIIPPPKLLQMRRYPKDHLGRSLSYPVSPLRVIHYTTFITVFRAMPLRRPSGAIRQVESDVTVSWRPFLGPQKLLLGKSPMSTRAYYNAESAQLQILTWIHRRWPMMIMRQKRKSCRRPVSLICPLV